MEISLITKHPQYLIINKPAGLIVHSDGKTKEPNVVDWIKDNYPEIIGVGEDMEIKSRGGEIITLERPGIVHRLDRETSGCLIIARTQEMFEHLKDQFKNSEVKKVYRAFVYGWVKDDEGEIDAAIGRSRGDFRKWSAQRGARGNLRPAQTEYKVVKRFTYEGEKFTSIEFYPRTGRTHQIRVHAKYMNHPIVADALYAGKLADIKPNLGFNRHALHAYKISFIDLDEQEVFAESSLPHDFEHVDSLFN